MRDAQAPADSSASSLFILRYGRAEGSANGLWVQGLQCLYSIENYKTVYRDGRWYLEFIHSQRSVEGCGCFGGAPFNHTLLKSDNCCGAVEWLALVRTLCVCPGGSNGPCLRCPSHSRTVLFILRCGRAGGSANGLWVRGSLVRLPWWMKDAAVLV